MAGEIKNVYESSLAYKILVLCAKEDNTPSQIANRLDLSMQAISKYLRSLRKKRLLIREMDGRKAFYSLNDEEIYNLWKEFNEDKLGVLQEDIENIVGPLDVFKSFLVKFIYELGFYTEEEKLTEHQTLLSALESDFWNIIANLHLLDLKTIDKEHVKKYLEKIIKLDRKVWGTEGRPDETDMLIRIIDEATED